MTLTPELQALVEETAAAIHETHETIHGETFSKLIEHMSRAALIKAFRFAAVWEYKIARCMHNEAMTSVREGKQENNLIYSAHQLAHEDSAAYYTGLADQLEGATHD